MEAARSASQERVLGNWPRYDAAALGFRHYWYPVMFSRQLRRKPRAITLCGEQIVLVRDGGRVYALQDRCPHRGVPLSCGRREFPGMLTCAYHGWTYDLQTGRLEVVLTDGPDSPIRGKANVRTYPAEERAGLIWVYVGAAAGDEPGAPRPPVEEDVPEELLLPNTVVEGFTQVRKGNWRWAAENGIDEGHGRFLHRTALWTTFRKMPAWTQGTRMVPSEDGKWLLRQRGQSVFQDTYPRVGKWPPQPWWRNRRGGAVYHKLGIRLPCILINTQDGWADYEIWVPWDEDHHLAVMLAVTHATGLRALLFRLWYRLWVRWAYYGGFNGQDQWMIEQMQIPPERLYRPDVSITAWRKWCQEQARRGAAPATAPAGDWASAADAEYAAVEAATAGAEAAAY